MRELERLPKAELIARLEQVDVPEVEALGKCVVALKPLVARVYVHGRMQDDTSRIRRVLVQIATHYGIPMLDGVDGQ